MKKIVFGKPKAQVAYTAKETQIVAAAPVEKIQEVVVEKHTETTILKEVKTHDKLARRHSRLAKKRMEKSVDELTDILNLQNDALHSLGSRISASVEMISAAHSKIKELEARKPEEKHIVTEIRTETVVKPSVPKSVWVILAISLLTNIYILVVK